MDPREFLILAEFLLEEGASPVPPSHCRTAISRAYYAAFGVAAKTLADIGSPLRKSGEGHSEAVRYLGNCDDAALAKASIYLQTLHQLRNKADYEMSNSDVERLETARTATKNSRKIMAMLDAFRGDRARRIAAKSAIEAYKNNTNQ